MPNIYLVIALDDSDNRDAPLVTLDPDSINPSTECWSMTYDGQRVDDFLFQYSTQAKNKGDKTYTIHFELVEGYEFVESGEIDGHTVTEGVVWDSTFNIDDSLVKSKIKNNGKLAIKARKGNGQDWENLQFGFKFAVKPTHGEPILSPDPRVIIAGDGHLPN